MRNLIFFLISFYRSIAPERMRNSCRFSPTCSEYMLLAVNKYGCLKGVALGVRRLCKCHPPNGGVDPP
ncbi:MULTISPECIES: membrane protein insertion efficiency factor YidD [unclassified Paraburkholderia]|uniref:membrane protein insertion efficiency factor YidD n=1 Tax=unclassified Paraburkholderia TaxID=2615204 RepID=UPI00160DBDD1|nr:MULTISPECIES: membrane protein insertion efficiency factor YidD [unclassified Paraburkholderia]